jgi:thiamine-monophosphate kinase
MLVAYAEAARQYGVEIIGGDFSRAEKLTISVTAIGRVVTRPLLRSGARPGDRVYVSRPIGGSAAGLALLGRDVQAYAQREFIESAIRRQVDPEPELALGVALARIDEVTACIDISDGLSSDLHHLCDASQCGAEIEKERIPVFPDLLAYGAKLGINVKDAVLHGGEEYALLFTSSLRESGLSTRLGRPVYAIGRMTSGREVILKDDGVAQPFQARGWDHFA